MTPQGDGKAAGIRVNGEWRALKHATLAALLEEIGYSVESRGIAVAVNEEVVPRARWADCVLSAGDSVEIVSAVQGG